MPLITSFYKDVLLAHSSAGIYPFLITRFPKEFIKVQLKNYNSFKYISEDHWEVSVRGTIV